MSSDDPQRPSPAETRSRVADRAASRVRWPLWLLAVGVVLSVLWTALLAYEGLRLFQWLAS